jgi:hypothetical protein
MKKIGCDDGLRDEGLRVRRHHEDGEQGLFSSHLADHPVDGHVVARRARRADHLWRDARYRER